MTGRNHLQKTETTRRNPVTGRTEKTHVYRKPVAQPATKPVQPPASPGKPAVAQPAQQSYKQLGDPRNITVTTTGTVEGTIIGGKFTHADAHNKLGSWYNSGQVAVRGNASVTATGRVETFYPAYQIRKKAYKGVVGNREFVRLGIEPQNAPSITVEGDAVVRGTIRGRHITVKGKAIVPENAEVGDYAHLTKPGHVEVVVLGDGRTATIYRTIRMKRAPETVYEPGRLTYWNEGSDDMEMPARKPFGIQRYDIAVTVDGERLDWYATTRTVGREDLARISQSRRRVLTA